ncbi:MAG: enoyl-CoA hydratase-related protein, partial [Thermodesulfobacteriota bacterium]
SAVGERNAEKVLLTGAIYTAEDALRIGLVDSVTAEETLMAEAKKNSGRVLAEKFRCLQNLEKPVAQTGSRLFWQERRGLNT